MGGVGGIVERDGKIRTPLFAVEIGDGLAGEIAPRDPKGAALSGHQRIEIDIRFHLVDLARDPDHGARRGVEASGYAGWDLGERRRDLGQRWRCKEKAGSCDGVPAVAFCHALGANLVVK